MSRKRYRCPGPPLQPIAKAVWSSAFPGDSWPRGWRVEWAGFMRGALGLCSQRERRIILSYGDAKNPKPQFCRASGAQPEFWYAPACVLETLVHEFIHVRWPRLKHGQDFTRLIGSALDRVWEATK